MISTRRATSGSNSAGIGSSSGYLIVDDARPTWMVRSRNVVNIWMISMVDVGFGKVGKVGRSWLESIDVSFKLWRRTVQLTEAAWYWWCSAWQIMEGTVQSNSSRMALALLKCDALMGNAIPVLIGCSCVARLALPQSWTRVWLPIPGHHHHPSRIREAPHSEDWTFSSTFLPSFQLSCSHWKWTTPWKVVQILPFELFHRRYLVSPGCLRTGTFFCKFPCPIEASTRNRL